jgi:hypothetical protein
MLVILGLLVSVKFAGATLGPLRTQGSTAERREDLTRREAEEVQDERDLLIVGQLLRGPDAEVLRVAR